MILMCLPEKSIFSSKVYLSPPVFSQKESHHWLTAQTRSHHEIFARSLSKTGVLPLDLVILSRVLGKHLVQGLLLLSNTTLSLSSKLGPSSVWYQSLNNISSLFFSWGCCQPTFWIIPKKMLGDFHLRVRAWHFVFYTTSKNIMAWFDIKHKLLK